MGLTNPLLLYAHLYIYIYIYIYPRPCLGSPAGVIRSSGQVWATVKPDDEISTTVLCLKDLLVKLFLAHEQPRQ